MTGEVCFCDTWEVLKVEVYARVRRAVQVDGMSVRRAAQEFHLSRKTIRKIRPPDLGEIRMTRV